MSKTYHTPEKIVIVAGPSFGQALKFIALGALIGAGAVIYSRPKPAPPTYKAGKAGLADIAAKYDAAIEDFSASDAATPEITDRLTSIASRLKSIGSRAKQLVETASEAVKPTLENAISEGKRVASEVQTNLKKDVDEAGDKPAIAREDGELPSEKEDKLVE